MFFIATLIQIAEKTGLSVSTVSRVLNHDATLNVSDDTRLKIFETAELLNYKTIKQRRTASKRLNFLILGWYSEFEMLNDPYYLYLLMTIEKECAALNINTIKTVKLDGEYKLTYDVDLDGVLAIGKFSPKDIEIIQTFSENIVFIDGSPMDSKYSSVLPNYYLGVSQALEHLINLGHKRIGFVGGIILDSRKEPMEDYLKSSFTEYLLKLELYNPDLIFIGKNLSFEEGYSIASNFSDTEILDALFVANDTMASGVIRGLVEKKLRVPEDISVIGFNNLVMAQFSNPPLTTVEIPLNFIAKSAIETLKSVITEADILPKKIIIPCELIIRNTTTRR